MLQNLKIKTSDNESISINDVEYMGLGHLCGRQNPSTEEICITSNRGTFSFPLSNIKSIEFTIKNDKRVIKVTSNETKKGEKQKCQVKN